MHNTPDPATFTALIRDRVRFPGPEREHARQGTENSTPKHQMNETVNFVRVRPTEQALRMYVVAPAFHGHKQGENAIKKVKGRRLGGSAPSRHEIAVDYVLGDELVETAPPPLSQTATKRKTAATTTHLAVLETSCVESDPPVRVDVLDLSLRGEEKIQNGTIVINGARHQHTSAKSDRNKVTGGRGEELAPAIEKELEAPKNENIPLRENSNQRETGIPPARSA